MKSPDKTKTLLRLALGLDTEARTLMLEGINDETIKSQLQTLLADDAQQQAFLQQNSEPTTAIQTIEPGSLIKRIRIIKLLGQGGMGSVYLGFDEKLERQVAVKSIRPEHLKNPATQQRFVREAQILSKINHPSICQLYDYIETDEGDFLVLEYIKGQPLYKTPLTEAQKLQVLADLSAALAVAHEHGIVHRDLKPDNIMVTEQGQLKVLDFGIAQSLSQPKKATSNNQPDIDPALTQQGSLVGTIRYMSPEQAKGQHIETASDMYALGIIALEVFSHQAAYAVMETEQLLQDVQQGKRLVFNELTEPISQLVDDLTALNPSLRPTAVETQQRLQNITHAPQIKRRKMIKYGALGMASVVVVMLWWQWQHIDQQASNNEKVNNYENQINDLVKKAEQIYVLPPHRVDSEINQVLQQGDQLYNEITQDQLLSETAKNRLLGIIMLEGEFYAEAIPMLVAGRAESRLLADAWTMLYIEKATEFSDQHGMEKTLSDPNLKANYLKPALAAIEQAHDDAGEVNPLFHAFELSQVESLEAGLRAINEVLATEQWNKKAVNLKALILSASMTQAREVGQWDLAKTYALKTAETYQRSIEMARSYPPSYSSLCLVKLGLMSDGIQRSGSQVMDYATQGISACEQALALQPNNTYPMQLLSTLYIMQAQWQTSLGINADESLLSARDWNQKAGPMNNLYSSSWRQALILATEGKQAVFNGDDGGAMLQQASELLVNMLDVDSEYKPYVVGDLLFVLATQSHNMMHHNQDPSVIIHRAQNLYDEIILTPDLMVSEQLGLINNMAQVYWVQLYHELLQGRNILTLGNKLITFLNPADNLLKQDPNQLINLANTHLLMVEYSRRHNLSAETHLQAAAEYISQAQSINDTDHNIMLSKALLLTLTAYYSDQNYTAANQSYQQALAINGNNPYNHHAWAEGLLIQAANSPNQQALAETINQANELVQLALMIDNDNHTFNRTLDRIKQLATSNGITLSP